jgi:capsular exopolysaccharide synthesis family protein
MEQQPTTGEKQIDYIDSLMILLRAYLRHWIWLALIFIAFLAISMAYSRYSKLSYTSRGLLMIQDEKQSPGSSELSVLKDLGILKGESNVSNEIELLRSRTLLRKVVEELRLHTELFALSKTTGLLKQDLYLRSPLRVSLSGVDSLPEMIVFDMTLDSPKHYQITCSELQFKGAANLGDTIATPAGMLSIAATSLMSDDFVGKDFLIRVLPVSIVIDQLQENLEVKQHSKESTVIEVALTGPNIDRSNDIINTLFKQREIDAIEDNNQIARKTSEFIQARMGEIASDLSEVENQESAFKVERDITDIPTNAYLYLNQQGAREAEIQSAAVQLKLCGFVYDYLKGVANPDELLPSNIGLNDPTINAGINQYNALIIEKQQLKNNVGEKNPQLITLVSKLENIRQFLLESLRNKLSVLELEIKQLEVQSSSIDSKLRNLSGTDRDFRTIQRQQKIMETLYLFLLQKKEENEITLAATISNNKVIDYAYSDYKPNGLSKKAIVVSGALAGLFLPFMLFLLYAFFDDIIRSAKEIDPWSSSVIGSIPLQRNAQIDSIDHSKRSLISESFRMLRTNINFMLGSKKATGSVVLVSSAISGEGKSFTALNLAKSFAIANQRTALLELDLRKPNLFNFFNEKKNQGISSYLATGSGNIMDFATDTSTIPHLTFFACGIVPPNPAELLMSKHTASMFETLRHHFDVIVVDTSPLSLVADTSLLAEHSDTSLLVIRLNYSKRSTLKQLESLSRKMLNRQQHIVINGADIPRDKHYSYNYYSENKS